MSMGYKDPDKRRKYAREWRAQRRSEFFRGKVCEICGSGKELELDHIDPTTKVSHNIWSWSRERREAEIIKCQILCRLCHYKKSKYDVTKVRGERVWKSKLTESQVLIIRNLFLEGTSKRKLGKIFGVYESTVRKIIARETWTHI